MPSGTLCPQCGKPVMPYGRFLREAEPNKVSRCSSCDAALKRKKSVWLLLGAGVVVGVMVALVGIPLIVERWGVVAAAVSTVLFMGVAVIGLNVCGWLFVGWDLVASEKRD